MYSIARGLACLAMRRVDTGRMTCLCICVPECTVSTTGMTVYMYMNEMLQETSPFLPCMEGEHGFPSRRRGNMHDGGGFMSVQQKSPAKPSLSCSQYFLSELFLWDLDRHSWLDLRTAQSVEVHDVLCAYARIVLCNAVE